jgi:hypothetical protein
VLAVGCAVPATRAADESPANESTAAEMRRVWWDTAEQIGKRGDWAECAAPLAATLDRHPDGNLAPRLGALLTSIQMSADHPPTDAFLDRQTDTKTLIAALPAVSLRYTLLLRPLQSYGAEQRLIWAVYADNHTGTADASAFLLYAQGRAVIPRLIELLDDQRATRSVESDASRFKIPLVFRVGDVSLALIEAISLCRFHLDPYDYHPRTRKSPLISEWTEEKRNQQIALIREWWENTKTMSLGDAVLWRLERATREQQIQMLDALVGTGRHAVAQHFLADRFRHGDELDKEFSRRLLRAGSRLPLEFLHRAVAQGRPVDHDLISLIVEFGEIDDFRLLRDAVLGQSSAHPDFSVDRAMLVNLLNYSDNTLAVPVLVAVIEAQMHGLPNDARAIRPAGKTPAYLTRAAEKLQTLTARDFGFGQFDSPYATAHGFENILRWWQREGKSAYDFPHVRPHAPGGIR